LHYSCQYIALLLSVYCTIAVSILHYSCQYIALFLSVYCTIPVSILHYSCQYIALFLSVYCTIPVSILYYSCQYIALFLSVYCCTEVSSTSCVPSYIWLIFFFHCCTVHFDVIQFFISPNNAQQVCFKILKFTLKYRVIQKDGLNFVSLYFTIRTCDKYGVNYIWLEVECWNEDETHAAQQSPTQF